MKAKKGECYLCGEIKELTVDHVPPRAFFPKPIIGYNLITLPACFSCNNSWGEKETKLVHDLSIAGASDDSRKVFTENTRANYMRGAIIRGKPSKNYYDILSRLKKSYIKTQVGIILPQKQTLLFIPKDRDEVLIKIAKGLHRFHKGKRVPSNAGGGVISRVPRIQDNFFCFKPSCTFVGRYGETFCYMGGFASDDANVSFWYLGFYTNLDFLVVFDKTGNELKKIGFD